MHTKFQPEHLRLCDHLEDKSFYTQSINKHAIYVSGEQYNFLDSERMETFLIQESKKHLPDAASVIIK